MDEKRESARIVKFVKVRQATRKAIAKDAEGFANAEAIAQVEIDHAREQKTQQKAQGPSWARWEAIFARVIDQGYTRVDIDGLRGLVVDENTPLTDELWKDVQLKPFVPLLVDFLVLLPVKALWQPGKKVTTEQWEAHLDDIREEVNHFRLDLVLHTLQLILDATTDPDKAEGERGETAETGAFFDPSGISGANPTTPNHPRKSYERREDAIGTLIAVLQHQDADHNTDAHLAKTSQFSAEPRFRIILPLEVACAISALRDLGNLDYNSATKSDLDELSKVNTFEWENSKTYKRFFHGDDAWKDLVFEIKHRGEKLAKLKSSEVLDPPCIVMKRSTCKVERQARLAAAAARKAAAGVEESASVQGGKSVESSDKGEEPSIKRRNSSVSGLGVFDNVDSQSDNGTEEPDLRTVKVEQDDSSAVGSGQEDE
ncbi:hypothetical protein JCM10295v2_005756 [Rhodotorula toruloides]